MNASAIVEGSPEKSLVRTELGADQPVRMGASVGDWSLSWAGAIEEVCWRIEERTVVVVRWSGILNGQTSREPIVVGVVRDGYSYSDAATGGALRSRSRDSGTVGT